MTVGGAVTDNLARAQNAMEALQRGKPHKSHFGIGFAEVGQTLAVFTPKRGALIARLRETGPLTTAELARKLDRDYKNVHADVAFKGSRSMRRDRVRLLRPVLSNEV